MEPSDASSSFRTMPQRIVFLIDLQPLYCFQNPNPYISSIISSIKTLANFAPLASSLFAFKFFFSSHSPLLSTSKVICLLGKSAAFISFDSPSQTLNSLSHVFASISSLSPADVAGDRVSLPRAALLAGSLRQIAHDYAWEAQVHERRVASRFDIFGVASNLVFLFSPIAKSLEQVREFLDKEVSSMDAFRKEFSCVFGAVKDGFLNRDMHFCWVDVCSMNDCEGEVGGGGECGFLQSGIRGLGWGFCSTDVIILGSALVPFGLIYPNIGSSMLSKFGDVRCKVGRAELILGITDVKGKPLECKFCDLEVFDINLPRERSADLTWILECSGSGTGSCEKRKRFWREGDNGVIRIRVKEVWRDDVEFGRKTDSACDILLLRRSGGECRTNQEMGGSNDFFADKVLDMLKTEVSEFVEEKPCWQLLLNFLHKKSYLGFVSISSSSGGDSIIGVLKPLTIHYAVLYTIDGDGRVLDASSSNILKLVNNKNADFSEVNLSLNQPHLVIDSQIVSHSCDDSSVAADEKKRRRRKHSNLLVDFSWCSFRKAVLDSYARNRQEVNPKINLEDVYFARGSNNSKKLRFLKCWMKQMAKSSFQQNNPHETKAELNFEEEIEERPIRSQQGSELPSSHSSSGKETSLSVPAKEGTSHSGGPAKEEISHSGGTAKKETSHSGGPAKEEISHGGGTAKKETSHSGGPAKEISDSGRTAKKETSHSSGPAKDETSTAHCMETTEAFYENVSQKIQQSIDSGEADLGFVAERLVNLCIHWLQARLKRDATGPENLGDIFGEAVTSEVERLLLRKPKDLATKYRTCNSLSSFESDSNPVIYTSEIKVREHELQILLRMEMLLSRIGVGIGDTAKQKMVKDICMLLENIEFNLQGGMFGGESLVEFVGRTIKARYSCTLHDIIDKVYTQMEFLSFDDDNQETTGSLPDSEEHRVNREENGITRETDFQTAGVSGSKSNMLEEDGHPYLQEGSIQSIHGAQDKVEQHRLMEAKERRERARRFASFTSWVPDLRRLWAPKQPRAARAKAGSLRKPSNRRKRQRDPNDVVLETPIAGAKLQCIDEVSDRKLATHGIYISNSVSKALFLNDDDVTTRSIA